MTEESCPPGEDSARREVRANRRFLDENLAGPDGRARSGQSTAPPGETRRVTIELDRRAFSYYDVNARQWKAEPGDFEVLVGSSSAKIELRGKVLFRPAAGRPGEE